VHDPFALDSSPLKWGRHFRLALLVGCLLPSSDEEHRVSPARHVQWLTVLACSLVLGISPPRALALSDAGAISACGATPDDTGRLAWEYTPARNG
jgi:hypothetical protein